MRKKIIIPVLIVIGIVLFFIVYPQTNFKRFKLKRESIVDMIVNSELSVEENGCIKLPNELKKISNSGECFIVEFNGKTAIYFYTNRGILESSKGYVYLTDKISYRDYINTEKYSSTSNFVNVVKLDDNWYSCSTD